MNAWGVLRPLLAAILLAACSQGEPELDPARFTDEECGEPGGTRCLGTETFQSCQQWRWYNEDACSGDLVCVEGLGCAGCDPFGGPTCVGDDVHICHQDGSIGAFVEACGQDSCHLGYCQQSECPEETQLIYLVDDQGNLLSFDPRDEAFTFEVLGALVCPAAPPLAGWGTASAARPNSMGVDRSGTAWIAWTSGEIFHVPVRDPDRCEPSAWTPQTGGFERFGMGFVSDTPGSSAETLFLSGGTVADLAVHLPSRLATLDPTWFTFTPRGSLPQTENNAELTGTGAAELYGYIPGEEVNQVARIDKDSGGFEDAWPLPPLGGPIRSWAFAHWGDRFYLFVSVDEPAAGVVAQVLRFDRETGTTQVVVAEHPYRVVGAGVSTCAPVVFQ